MSPVHIQPTDEQKDSEFAKLFEGQTVVSGTPTEGAVVKGKVVAHSRDQIIIDVGLKSEGAINAEEFKTIQGELEVSIGDEVDVFVEKVEDEHGMIVLSKQRADAIKAWDKLIDISNENGVVEGRVVSKVKGGLSVDIGVKAFLPASQADIRPPKNLEQYVGQIYKFRIIKINKKRGNVVLSRKVVLDQERESMKEETLKNLAIGQVFDGIVKNIMDYGVFVDIGGIDGLLHVTDMSWGRLNHPSEIVKVGEGVRVVILKYDPDNQKVSLGMKQLQPDPWSTVEEKYGIGNRVRGRVVSLTDYGAFISLEDGVEGLIHVSEMSWTKKVKHPSKILSVGETLETLVLDVSSSNRRISLGLKQIMPNPWHELEEKHPIGSKVTGIIRNVADFGVFVEIGDIDGLVHISDLTWVQNFAHPTDVYKKGQELEAVVLHIDPDNEKFSLGVKHLLEDPWDQINAQYAPGTEVEAEVVTAHGGGVIVKLEEGVEGFVPTEAGGEGLEAGETVSVKVSKADQRERQFHLDAVGKAAKKKAAKAEKATDKEEVSAEGGEEVEPKKEAKAEEKAAKDTTKEEKAADKEEAPKKEASAEEDKSEEAPKKEAKAKKTTTKKTTTKAKTTKTDTKKKAATKKTSTTAEKAKKK